MKGYRFYAAMPEARRSKGKSRAFPVAWTVAGLQARANAGGAADLVAVYLDDAGRPYWQGSTQSMDAVTTCVEGNPQSYCGCSVSRDYLAARCVRVPESLARQLSPELFRYLES